MITTEVKTILWTGESDYKYKFWIHSIDANFKEEPGNYIFCYESSPGYWKPVYIGQTNNLNNRLENLP